MPGAMTGATGVRRSESLNSNRSDLSHKKVSFNKDVSVKHIPRGALVDRNGQLIAVMPESADPKVWFASRRAERLNPDDIAREAQEILTQLDQVTCTASSSPFQEHPHSRTYYSIPANNMYDHGHTYSKTLPNPHKKNNIESKNNKLKNIADKNKLNKEASKNKGSTSSTEKRRKSLETILESGGQNGYINLNSLSKTSSLNNVNESAFSDSDYYPAAKTKQINIKHESPTFQELKGNSGVKALVSHFNEESQRRQEIYGRGGPPGVVEPSRDVNHNNNMPFSYLRPPEPDEGIDEVDKEKENLKSPREVVYAQVVVKNKDKTTTHSKYPQVKTTKTETYNHIPYKKQESPDRYDDASYKKQPSPDRYNDTSYKRHPSPDRYNDTSYKRQPSPNRYNDTSYKRQPSPNRYNDTSYKRQPSPNRYNDTSYKRQPSPDRYNHVSYKKQASPDRYNDKKQPSPDRFTSSTYPRPNQANKKQAESKLYSTTNPRNTNKDKLQSRITNDSSGKTKIYLTSQDAKAKNKHVARVNLNGTSSPRGGSVDRASPDRHYFYGESSRKPAVHRTVTKTSSGASSSTTKPQNDLTSMRLVKQANETSFNKSKQSFIKNRPVKEVQSEGEDKKRKKVKITFHEKPSRTDSDIENLKGYVEYKGQSDKEDKIQRSRKHFLSAFLEKAPRGPLSFRKKTPAAKSTHRKTNDSFDSDSQMVWSSPGEEMDDVLRYSNKGSGHKAAPKLWFSSEDLGWPERADSSLDRPPKEKKLHSSSREPPRSHSLDRRSKSPKVVAHRSPNYLSRMNRYLSETDRESASQFSESEVGGLQRRRPGASTGELSTDTRQRRATGVNSNESTNEAQRRRKIRLKRSVSSAAILNPRDPISSTGSTANSSESENGTTSGNSGRSVYLHAMTVADIPPLTTRAGSSIISKDDMLEKPGRSRQSRSVTRSLSVAAPWKPRNYKEPYDIPYSTNGRPPRPPRRRDKIQENVTTIEKEGANPVRRVQTSRDGTKLAGWFRKKPTSQPKQEIRRR